MSVLRTWIVFQPSPSTAGVFHGDSCSTNCGWHDAMTITSWNEVPTVDRETRALMGVINLLPSRTVPHSFANSPQSALLMADRYRSGGIAYLDIGAQSSKYDAKRVTEADELALLLPVVELLAARAFMTCVETWRPRVAELCLEAGALIINDTSGYRTQAMVDAVSRGSASAVVCYKQGRRPGQVDHFDYSRATVADISDFLRREAERLRACNVESVIVDPGVGISYPKEDDSEYTSYQVRTICGLPEMAQTSDCATLIAVPRRATIPEVVAFAVLAAESGANILRVHDIEVAEAVSALGWLTR